MPRDGELKIPDQPFRNRSVEPESSTGGNPLRTNAAIRGTARTAPPAPRGVRPLELYFFSGIFVVAALAPAGACRPEPSAAAAPTATPAAVSTATPPPSAGADLFRSTVRPVLLAHCAPCHEPGGKMYERLPFEDPQVVADHRAGVLRRLKAADREAVEKWLATLPPPTAAP